MSEARDVNSAGSKWRRWAGAIALVVIAAVAIQLLVHELFMDADMVQRHIFSGLLQALIVLVPVVMYLVWRRAAEREADVSRRLRDSEALREDLVNMLIHDLKGPAVTTGLALNALARNGSDGADRTEDDEDLLQIARDGVDRLEHMIGDMLDAASAEADALQLNVDDIGLAALVRDAIRENALTSEERKIRVHGPSQDGDVPLRADGPRIRRVVDNLLLNAIKFTPAGGDVEITVASGEEDAQVTVRDSGPGVPHHVQEHIFDKYRQAEISSGQRTSVGLGLAFCRLIVEAHGGRIWVSSDPGNGSIFTFSLPLEGPSGRVHKRGLRRWKSTRGTSHLLRI